MMRMKLNKQKNINEIQFIIPPALPYSLDEKIFNHIDQETGGIYGDPYSYNDWISEIKNISGVNEDLCGPYIV